MHYDGKNADDSDLMAATKDTKHPLSQLRNPNLLRFLVDVAYSNASALHRLGQSSGFDTLECNIAGAVGIELGVLAHGASSRFIVTPRGHVWADLNAIILPAGSGERTATSSAEVRA